MATGFTKALKREPLVATATIEHPSTGEKIEIKAAFRRMSDAEATAMEIADKARTQRGQEVTTEDCVDLLAPVFERIISGVDDFPADGTPDEQFRRYFGGDGSEAPEDLEVESKIVQAFYLNYRRCLFRLVPAELVETLSLLLRLTAEASKGVGNGAGA